MGGLREGPLIGTIPCVLPLLLWAVPVPSLACHFNPQAFQSNIPIHSDLLPNGMMALRYEGTEQESCPHVSVHRVMMTLPGHQLTIPEANNPEYFVIEVDGTIGWITYIVVSHALFYGVGQDSLGFPKQMWIDSEEDGLNGNEHVNGHPPLVAKR